MTSSVGWASGRRLFQGARGLWEIVIGLEVHTAVTARTKLFSAASAGGGASAAAPNSCVSLFDAAHPGTLPSPNSHAVEGALRAAAALRCSVPFAPAWTRKHYFYADLPAGYQITHAGEGSAIGLDGELEVEVMTSQPATAVAPPVATPSAVNAAPAARRRGGRSESEQANTAATPSPSLPPTYNVSVRIDRLQLEQDSGKSLHAGDWTLVDLNRAGVGLLEIVTAPDLRTAREAGAFLRELQSLLRHVGACEGAIEEGGMRCDVNVSVQPVSPNSSGGVVGAASTTAPRVETKNVASIRAVEMAIDCEAARQVALLEGRLADAAALDASPVPATALRSETRSFDALARRGALLRVKEGAADYRLLPEPDLLPLFLSPAVVAAAAARMPPPPSAVRARMTSLHGLAAYDARVLVAAQGGAAAYYDEAAAATCAAVGEATLPPACAAGGAGGVEVAFTHG